MSEIGGFSKLFELLWINYSTLHNTTCSHDRALFQNRPDYLTDAKCPVIRAKMTIEDRWVGSYFHFRLFRMGLFCYSGNPSFPTMITDSCPRLGDLVDGRHFLPGIT